ncbi:hypothetical protein PIB30_016860 [Stylosanthes scabra]|uniref:Polyphenol oxidase C-terminal domain-containing protein n=1 Tax=Stylosanthes scabra TaxID=79078 RepID=A0ABU6U7E4_9FABA|nr:hypothetical protein [Stylosanthes scabra]
MEIPAIFVDRRSPLYNPLRNANHQPLHPLSWTLIGTTKMLTVAETWRRISRKYTSSFTKFEYPVSTVVNRVNREFAGSFVNVNHGDTSRDTNVKYPIGITELLEDLEADDDDMSVIKAIQC